MKPSTDGHADQPTFLGVKRKVLSRARAAGYVDLQLERQLRMLRNDRSPLAPIHIWWDSPAEKRLRPAYSRGGIWIPHWLRYLTRDAACQRVLSWLLFLFDGRGTTNSSLPRNKVGPARDEEYVVGMQPVQFDQYTRVAKEGRHGKCRAQAWRDLVSAKTGEELRVRCLAIPVQKLAAQTGLSEKIVRRCLKELEKKVVILRLDNKTDKDKLYLGGPSPNDRQGGVLLFLNGCKLAEAFRNSLVDYGYRLPEISVTNELLFDWYGSEWRREAMNRDKRHYFQDDPDSFSLKEVRRSAVPGTWVSDSIYAICDENPGKAQVMAQLLHHCGSYRHESGVILPRMQTRREGRLWTARSVRALAKRLGLPKSSVHSWLRELAEKLKKSGRGAKSFFAHATFPRHRWNATERGVDHWSPNPQAILAALKDTADRSRELTAQRWPDRRVEPQLRSL